MVVPKVMSPTAEEPLVILPGTVVVGVTGVGGTAVGTAVGTSVGTAVGMAVGSGTTGVVSGPGTGGTTMSLIVSITTLEFEAA